MVNSVVEFFKEDKNMNVINKLKNVGVNIKLLDNIGEKVEKIFEGMKIVLIGIFFILKRNDVKDMIEKRGGKVIFSVSKLIIFVLVGEEVGFKFIKVSDLGIKVIDEERFLELLKLLLKDEVKVVLES